MKILDLFAGKGGEIRRPIIEALGHEYTTLDIDASFNCDTTADIMTIDDLGLYDFVWASVPCEKFSVSSIGVYWNKDHTPKTDEFGFITENGLEAVEAMKLVQHTIDLLQVTAKIGWVIENPRGKLRKMPFMQDIPRSTVTYCRYGMDVMKPTDIWHVGLNWTPRPMCHNGNPDHIAAPRGSRTGTQGNKTYADKSIVPIELWLEILAALADEA